MESVAGSNTTYSKTDINGIAYHTIASYFFLGGSLIQIYIFLKLLFSNLFGNILH